LNSGEKCEKTDILHVVLPNASNGDVYHSLAPIVSGFCSGGMELLFGNQKEIEVDISRSNDSQLTVGEIMAWARDNLLTERPEMFMKGSSV